MTSDSWKYLTLKIKTFYHKKVHCINPKQRSSLVVFFFTLDLVKKEPLYVGFKSFKTARERYIFDVSIHCYCFHILLLLKIVNFYVKKFVKWQLVILNFSWHFLVNFVKPRCTLKIDNYFFIVWNLRETTLSHLFDYLANESERPKINAFCKYITNYILSAQTGLLKRTRFNPT